MREVDYLVAGQGLAGTVFALQARERGRRVLIVDPGDAVTSSRVAAGIINPLTGPKLNPGWRVDEMLPCAERFYREQEARLGARFYDPLPILRLFVDEAQAARAIAPEFHAPLPDNLGVIRAEWGGFTTIGSARLRVADFLDAARRDLDVGSGKIQPADVSFDSEGVLWRNEIRARCLICCLGHESLDYPWFNSVPLRRAKGEILSLRIPDFEETRIVSRDKWLLPAGEENFQAGSTFTWDPTDSAPTAAGRAEIEAGLGAMLPMSWEITGHVAAIRPMANRGRPILGAHPTQPGLAFLNGFGAKGALLAPWAAAHLLDHLESGTPVDPDVDVRRFF